MKILAISGSLRGASLNTALLRAAGTLLPPQASMEFADIRLPLYDADLPEVDKAAVTRLTDDVRAADGVLIATPEYNYGIPGPLKNALDWASRPAYKSAFFRKPVGLVGASPGAVGTARAQGQLKQVLLGMASQVFPHPEFLAGGAGAKFEDGELTDASTVEHLERYLAEFVAWVQIVAPFGRQAP